MIGRESDSADRTVRTGCVVFACVDQRSLRSRSAIESSAQPSSGVEEKTADAEQSRLQQPARHQQSGTSGRKCRDPGTCCWDHRHHALWADRWRWDARRGHRVWPPQSAHSVFPSARRRQRLGEGRADDDHRPTACWCSGASCTCGRRDLQGAEFRLKGRRGRSPSSPWRPRVPPRRRCAATAAGSRARWRAQ